MSRVLGVVGRSIKIGIYDVVPGDIIYVSGNESDPIVDRVERDGDAVRYIYKPRQPGSVGQTIWMIASKNYESLFVHDLKNERADFVPSEEQACQTP